MGQFINMQNLLKVSDADIRIEMLALVSLQLTYKKFNTLKVFIVEFENEFDFLLIAMMKSFTLHFVNSYKSLHFIPVDQLLAKEW